jgi:C4-dicarboxylate transporter DctM subunit
MIVYALSANVSVADLFLAGVLPGLFIGATLIITVYVLARINGFDVVGHVGFGQWLRNLVYAVRRAALAILMPVLILGGIYGGLFTPTEASVVAVVYGLFIGIYVYKELSWKDVLPMLGSSAVTSSIILMIVGFASIFAYILTVNQVPHRVGEFIAGITKDPVFFLLMVNILLLVTGMFMETLAAIIILAPILAPAAILYGIDPIHFGIVMIVNLAVGMVTPPIGVNLFIVCQVARVKLEQLFRPLLIFLAVLVVDVLVISYTPTLTTWFK